MTVSSRSNDETLPLPLVRQVDDVCLRFEAAWRAATALEQRPRIEDFLGALPETAQAALVSELVALELELRRCAGEQAHPDEYRDRFPSLAAPQETILPSVVLAPAASVHIPGYEIIQELGRGGMGVVYRAWQKELNRTVALKMVHAGAQASPAMQARFQVEAVAVARLQHANIVQIYDVGHHVGSQFLVLELVEGRSLAQRVAGTPQPVRWAAELVETLARAIQSAHSQGVVHRDLTPANILLTADGVPKITDFGLAKLIIGAGELRTQTGELLGTPSYMAPEQAASRHQAIGVATDVYALGAILYELLSGRPPFKAESPLETMRQVLNDEPVAPSRLRPRLPADLETICLKCLRKEPAQRYSSALALAEDLRRFLDLRPILARRSGSFEQVWRWCKRNPALAAASITAAVLTILLAIGSTIAAWTYLGQCNELRFEQGRTMASLSRAEHAERDARLAEHKAQLALGQSLVSEGAALQRTELIGQRLKSLDRLGKAAQVLGADPEGRKRLPEIRNHAIAALGLTDLRMRREHNYGDNFGLGVDAALERYAVIEKSGAVVVRRLDDDSELVRLPGPDRRDFWNAASTFSPDGELLVAGYGQRGGGTLLRVWHLGRRELLGSLPYRGRWLFHPDGRRMLFDASEGSIGVWDRVERRVVRRLPLDFTPNYLALDPEGRQLAVNNGYPAAPRVVILDPETGRVLADWQSQVGNGAMAWSADGQLLAVGGEGYDPRVYVWNVRRGALSSILQGHTAQIVGAQFAHSGYLLATSSYDGRTRLWDAAARGSRWRLCLVGSWACHRMTAGRLSLWAGRSVPGTWPQPQSVERSTPACSATDPRRGTRPG